MPDSLNIRASGHLSSALEKLSRLPKRDDSGRISWKSSELESGTFEIIFSLRFTPPVDDHIKDGAIWHTLNECARANDFSPKTFLQKLRQFITTHISKSPKHLVAISQLNCLLFVDLPKSILSIHGTVWFKNNLIKIDRAIIQTLSAYEQDRLGLHDDFVYMGTTVLAADDRSALDIAYRNIKYCLGVLNSITGGFGISKRFGFPNAPMGKFLSASSIFTVDRKRMVLGGYLSENHFPLKFKSNFSARQNAPKDRIQKIVRRYVGASKRTDFVDKIVQATILFQEGLESTHIDIALLRFWTGIELLCFKDEKESSDKIAERACSIFDDRQHALMRLNFIQEFRNKIVHRGEAGDHSLLCAQWASIFLAEMIRFCLFNKYNLRLHADILDYLSTPTDKAKLQAMITTYRRRLRSVS